MAQRGFRISDLELISLFGADTGDGYIVRTKDCQELESTLGVPARKPQKARGNGKTKDADTIALEKRVSDALGLNDGQSPRSRRQRGGQLPQPRAARRGGAEAGYQGVTAARAAVRRIAQYRRCGYVGAGPPGSSLQMVDEHPSIAQTMLACE
jgi:hypothetical protein